MSENGDSNALQTLLTIIIGILGGISVGIQTPIANAIGKRVGSSASSFIVHISGAIFSALLLLRDSEGIKQINTLPWWMFGVGLFGVVLFLTINYTIPRLGATAAVALIILGQLSAGLLIDTFGWFDVVPKPLNGSRILGVLFLLIGGYIIAR